MDKENIASSVDMRSAWEKNCAIQASIYDGLGADQGMDRAAFRQQCLEKGPPDGASLRDILNKNEHGMRHLDRVMDGLSRVPDAPAGPGV